MSHARIYLQVDETEVSWCEHRVHDSDVEYVIADPGEIQKVALASEFSCPGCGTEFTVTATVKEALVVGADPE